ncbi:MAG: redoxin domain-containing protein [Planctomycetes bacterium]|nr:redoxin domain-containing protein [Planctomycetota bacterium]
MHVGRMPPSEDSVVNLIALLAVLVLPVQTPQAPTPTRESQAWEAAAQLKNKADYVAAAGRWEAYARDFPTAPRARQALVEAGVCYFSAGRGAQVLHRNTELASAHMEQARTLFDRVCAEAPKEPIASRARHMRGSTFLFSGELAQAEEAYSSVLEQFSMDRNYVEKALEYRAMTRRHLLKGSDAIADMERFLKDFPRSNRTENMKSELGFARQLGTAATPWKAERWIVGEPAPLEILSGQVVALYFWATWCPNCAKEEAFVIDLARRLGPKGLALIGVTDHQQGQTPESILLHVQSKGYNFPVFQDNGATSLAYKATSIPHLVLIDRHGKVRWNDSPADLYDATIMKLLAEE